MLTSHIHSYETPPSHLYQSSISALGRAVIEVVAVNSSLGAISTYSSLSLLINDIVFGLGYLLRARTFIRGPVVDSVAYFSRCRTSRP